MNLESSKLELLGLDTFDCKFKLTRFITEERNQRWKHHKHLDYIHFDFTTLSWTLVFLWIRVDISIVPNIKTICVTAYDRMVKMKFVSLLYFRTLNRSGLIMYNVTLSNDDWFICFNASSYWDSFRRFWLITNWINGNSKQSSRRKRMC